MQLTVARLRQSWPLFLFALLALRRWWLKRGKNGLSELPRSLDRCDAKRTRGKANGRPASRNDFGYLFRGYDRRSALRNVPGGHAYLCFAPRTGRGHSVNRLAVKSPLWIATEKGDIETVMQLLGTGQDTEQKYKGWSPLMKAAEEGAL